MNVDLMKEFAAIENRLDTLDGIANRLKARKKEIEPEIMNDLATNEIDQIKVRGRTIFVHSRPIIKQKSRADTIQALKDAKLVEYVAENFNTTSVTAFVAELVRNDEPLPEEFGDRIKADVVLSLRSSKSG